MEKELKDRIATLRAKLDDKYMPKDIRREIEVQIDLLLSLQRALYFY